MILCLFFLFFLSVLNLGCVCSDLHLRDGFLDSSDILWHNDLHHKNEAHCFTFERNWKWVILLLFFFFFLSILDLKDLDLKDDCMDSYYIMQHYVLHSRDYAHCSNFEDLSAYFLLFCVFFYHFEDFHLRYDFFDSILPYPPVMRLVLWKIVLHTATFLLLLWYRNS